MALVSFEALVKNCVENGLTEENIRLIVLDLERNNVEFLDFIRCIGPSLVDSDKGPRLNATKLLSEVVSKLKASFFSHNEVKVLLEFLCAKFTDHHLIAPSSLKGLVALSQAEALSPEMMKFIVRSIFKDLTVQTLLWNERSLVYSVFDFFLKNHLEELKEMNGELVIGFVQLVDSERDARNLIVVFDMVSLISSEVPLGAVAQDLFEFISEYFPVEFTPDPGFDWKISKDDLSKALKRCFTSSPEFADYAIPLLIEKMSSNVLTSKLDSLEYLSACCNVYHPNKISEFSERLWNAIKQKVYSMEAELESSCLSAVVAITKNLSRNQSEEEEPSPNLIQFLNLIFKDCSKYLHDASLDVFHRSVEVLLAASFASVGSSRFLAARVVNELLVEFDVQKQAAPRAKIVKSLLLFIDGKQIPVEKDGSESGSGCIGKVLEGVVRERKREILDAVAVIGGNQSPELKSLSLWGSVALVGIDSLTEEERASIVEHMADLSTESSPGEVRKSVLGSLESLSALRGDLCLKIVLPRLMSVITSELEKQSDCDVERLEHMISAVSHMSRGRDLVSKVVPELLKIVDGDSGNNGPRLAAACVDGLVRMVESNLAGDGADFICSSFVSDCRDSILRPGTRTEAGDERAERTLQGLASCIRMVVESGAGGSIPAFAEEVSSLFLESAEKHEDDKNPMIRKLLYLVLASVCSMKYQEQLKNVDRVTRCCYKLARNSKDLRTSAVASKCFACLINKIPQGPFLDELLDTVEDELLAVLSAGCKGPTEGHEGDCTLWSWMTKALVARNHERQTLFCNQMVDMLSLPHLSERSSEGFKVVLGDFKDVLSPKSHSSVTIMYRQRFFSLTIHRLIDAFHLCQKDLKKNFLEALSCLNTSVPKQVVHQELKLILPLLVLSLGGNSSPEAWASSLPVLCYFIDSSPQEVGKYFDDFLPRLLEISRYPDKMSIRLEALKCLALMPEKLSLVVLMPRQRQAIRAITESLQDPKRLVRRTASIANCAWHMVSEPQEEEE